MTVDLTLFGLRLLKINQWLLIIQHAFITQNGE